MSLLVLVRHGESLWNRENRFTGWVDVPLTEKGREEARRAGRLLRGFRFDIAFTSVLQRATETLEIVLREIGQPSLPVERDPALNERHYGELQGKNKAETARLYGEEQVRLWRRSYDVAPPGGESLKDTAARTVPYFERRIVPELRAGKNVLVVAHGNSLRALVMHLEKLSPEEILRVELGTGVPIVYEFDPELRLVRKTVLGTAEETNAPEGTQERGGKP
ncbi:MAG: 2,3-bisphosphoglycerate-dependent phosphoglycerate mutase 2 [Candidatus Binatia bacterium]|nr:MAG: 2,3-bisphosphoglycerate-dependent phosphoglycerate mutase 2 [Candidatus Binatia bacterium]